MQFKSVFHYTKPCPKGLEGCPYIGGAGEDICLANSYLEFLFTGSRNKDIMNLPVTVLAADNTASIAASSCSQYAHAICHLMNWLSSRTSSTLFNYTEEELDQFKSDMEEGRWSEEDGKKLRGDIIRTRLLQAINFGHWSVASGYRKSFIIRRRNAGGHWKNSSAYTILGRHIERTLKHIPADEQQDPFLEQLYHSTYFLTALLMLYVGLRIAEVVNIKVSDIPLELLLHSEKRVFIIIVEGKGRKTRPVTIGRDILELMSDYFYGAREDSLRDCRDRYDGKPQYKRSQTYFVLNNYDGQPISTHSTRVAIKEAAARAGMSDLTPHTLRHWYATSCLRKKYEEFRKGRTDDIADEELIVVLEREIAAIREDLGHSLDKTTMIYLRSFLKELSNRAAVKRQKQSIENLKLRRAQRTRPPELVTGGRS
jgi:integrase